MADDQRERQPTRDQRDNPPEAGTRSDHAGTSAGGAGVAAGGRAVQAADDRTVNEGERPSELDPLEDVKHPTADE